MAAGHTPPASASGRGHPHTRLAAGFGIGTTTAYRHVTEAVELPAALAPGLADAARAASAKAYPILDGMLLPIDWGHLPGRRPGDIAADRPFYFGKHQKHGMNVQVLADLLGRLLWASPARRRPRRPRGPRTLGVAPSGDIVDALAEAGNPVLGRQGLPGRRRHGPHPVPEAVGDSFRRPEGGESLPREDPGPRRAGRRPLTSWRLLRRLRCSTTRITGLVQAALAPHLTSSE
ncbi:hypothetical protein GCM10010420_56300 [Streptomyces glaucosporus]|uniref:Transposase n=1 Tax=Streptomyces glaucosporus TaxID=284044 RepID=A0ABN3J1C0_9ACTN